MASHPDTPTPAQAADCGDTALHQAAWNGLIEVGVGEGAGQREGCEYGRQRKCGWVRECGYG